MRYSTLLATTLAFLFPTTLAHPNPFPYKPQAPSCSYNEQGIYGCFGKPLGKVWKYPESDDSPTNHETPPHH
ncbi:hypothetical protein ACET3X_000025 [Alternaria dauci]|uniref:Uncharacterized protein n=1 Tax=Alternaria dauci TaxID=48095 RepID=A0ABR3UT86_9PLEO